VGDRRRARTMRETGSLDWIKTKALTDEEVAIKK
jgi:hypothetical protein